MEEPVAREVERIDLDLRLLSGMDEADVAVGEHGLDLELTLAWNHNNQRLRRRHHASHRVNGELLHDAVDRRSELLEFVRRSTLDGGSGPNRFLSDACRSQRTP